MPEVQPRQRRLLGTVLAAVLLVAAGIAVATTGDSWAVRLILTLVAIDIAVRLFRWSRPA